MADSNLKKYIDSLSTSYSTSSNRSDYFKSVGVNTGYQSYSKGYELQDEMKRLEEERKRLAIIASKPIDTSSTFTPIGTIKPTEPSGGFLSGAKSVGYSFLSNLVGMAENIFPTESLRRNTESTYQPLLNEIKELESKNSLSKKEKNRLDYLKFETEGMREDTKAYNINQSFANVQDSAKENLRELRESLEGKANLAQQGKLTQTISNIANLVPKIGIYTVPLLGQSLFVNDVFKDSIKETETRMANTGEKFSDEQVINKAAADATISLAVMNIVPVFSKFGKMSKSVKGVSSAAYKNFSKAIPGKTTDFLASNAMKELGKYWVREANRFGGIAVLRTLAGGIVDKLTIDKDLKYFGFKGTEDEKESILTMFSLAESYMTGALAGGVLAIPRVAQGASGILKTSKLLDKPIKDVTMRDMGKALSVLAKEAEDFSNQNQQTTKDITPNPQISANKTVRQPTTSTPAKTTPKPTSTKPPVSKGTAVVSRPVPKPKENVAPKVTPKTLPKEDTTEIYVPKLTPKEYTQSMENLSSGQTSLLENIERINAKVKGMPDGKEKTELLKELEESKTGLQSVRRMISAYEAKKPKGVKSTMPEVTPIPSTDVSEIKNKMYEIINKSNPAPDNNLTWVRSVDDIKTPKEVWGDISADEFGGTPDWNLSDAKSALKSGEVTVYSSTPIKEGAFVTPSKMEAQSYLGGDKVHELKVNVNDVAWIDELQGQYAKVLPAVKSKPTPTKAIPKDGNTIFSKKDAEIIQTYADEMGELNNKTPASYIKKGVELATAIKTKDFDKIADVVSSSNKVSLKMFNAMTGNNAKTNKEIANAINNMSGYSKWESDSIAKAKSAKESKEKEEKKAQQEKYNKLSEPKKKYEDYLKTLTPMQSGRVRKIIDKRNNMRRWDDEVYKDRVSLLFAKKDILEPIVKTSSDGKKEYRLIVSSDSKGEFIPVTKSEYDFVKYIKNDKETTPAKKKGNKVVRTESKEYSKPVEEKQTTVSKSEIGETTAKSGATRSSESSKYRIIPKSMSDHINRTRAENDELPYNYKGTDNKEVNERMDAAGSIEALKGKTKGISEKLKEVQESVQKNFLRGSIPELDWGEYQDLRFKINQSRQGHKSASKLALNITAGIYAGVPSEYEKLIRDAIIFKSMHDDVHVHFLYSEKDLKFGIKDIDELDEMYTKVMKVLHNPQDTTALKVIQNRQRAIDSVVKEYIKAADKATGLDFTDMFSRGDNYYKNMVMDYMNQLEKDEVFRKTVSKTFKERKGTDKDIFTNVELADFLTFTGLYRDIYKFEVLGALNKNSKPVKFDKNNNIIVPAGHEIILLESVGLKIPDKFFLKRSLFGAKIMMNELGVEEGSAEYKQTLKEVASESKSKTIWIVENRIANVIRREFGSKAEINVAHKWWIKGNQLNKQWLLKSPFRAFKYQLSNLSYDFDQNMLNPKSMKYFSVANKAVWNIVYHNKVTHPEILEFVKRGGLFSHEAFNILDVRNKYRDVNVYNQDGSFRKSKDIVKDINRTWGIDNFYTYRENIFRFMQYLSFLDELKNNKGEMPYYYASVKRYNKGITDIRDRAYELSNSLNQDYGDLPPVVSFVSEHMIPFIKGTHANNVHKFRAVMNAFRSDPEFVYRTGEEQASRLGYKGRAIALVIKRIGMTFLSLSAFSMVTQFWNRVIMKEHDDRVPEQVRKRPHLTLGTINNRTYYVSGFTSFRQALAPIGLEDTFNDAKRIMSGEFTFDEWAKNLLQFYKTQIVTSNPVFRLISEPLTGVKAFPDTTNIRDPIGHIFDSLQLRAVYRYIKGLPQENGKFDFSSAFFSSTMKNESYYWNIYGMIDDYYIEKGEPRAGYTANNTPKGMALYNMKTAIRYKDKDAALRYLEEYYILGGTGAGIKTSLANMYPLQSLSERDRSMFISSLSKEQKEEYDKGIEYYKEMLKEFRQITKGED